MRILHPHQGQLHDRGSWLQRCFMPIINLLCINIPTASCMDGWLDGWMDGWLAGWMDDVVKSNAMQSYSAVAVT